MLSMKDPPNTVSLFRTLEGCTQKRKLTPPSYRPFTTAREGGVGLGGGVVSTVHR